ncbi:MAG: hypothetical protein QOG38_1994, partial [Hyphomicrobiales bacterium]|nr:hypothetical protein [Hyphomicrobiales bacterium]
AAPAPLEALWTRPDLGAAFMCGFPFALAAPQPVALVAPIPSSPRYGGRPQYCTDFIVRADRSFTRLSDTYGGRIGWTVRHSQSGYNAVWHHLLGKQAAHYSEWVGPLVTPRRIIDAVLDGGIDVGPLDSYVHDLLKRHEPETAAKLCVVDSTVMTPIPLLVASPATDKDVVARLRCALLSFHSEFSTAATLDTLLLSRFATINPSGYQELLPQANDAKSTGMPGPGVRKD